MRGTPAKRGNLWQVRRSRDKQRRRGAVPPELLPQGWLLFPRYLLSRVASTYSDNSIRIYGGTPWQDSPRESSRRSTCVLCSRSRHQSPPSPRNAWHRSTNYHPAYLAKHLQALSAAGITEALLGRTGGYRLARDPRSISFLDIVDAIESDEPWFRCAEIRQCGPTAQPSSMYPSACDIASTIWSAERAWKNHLDSVNAVHSVGRTHCCCWSSPTRGDTGMAEVENRWHTSGLARTH